MAALKVRQPGSADSRQWQSNRHLTTNHRGLTARHSALFCQCREAHSAQITSPFSFSRRPVIFLASSSLSAFNPDPSVMVTMRTRASSELKDISGNGSRPNLTEESKRSGDDSLSTDSASASTQDQRDMWRVGKKQEFRV